MASRRALLSVSNKAGLVEFARKLEALGFELLSTGGTAKVLGEAGLSVTPVAEITGFPEVFGGRVKTLHPRIHGGLLARWGDAGHRAEASAHGIEPIELLVVNLYPFRETIARPGVCRAEAIEQIDIGGPAMIRAGAKNHEHVAVVVDPGRYDDVVEALTEGTLDAPARARLALAAFEHTASYDAAIAGYLAAELAEGDEAPLPAILEVRAPRRASLRYGENPHQRAAFYELPTPPGAPSIARAEQLNGKALSYNNLLDADAAMRIAIDLQGVGAVVIKHTNPCGVAEAAPGAPLHAVYQRARSTDPMSAFGGIVGFNQPVDEATALSLAETFLEAVIAPDFDEAALAVLRRKRNLRVLRLSPWPDAAPSLAMRTVAGGLLVQDCDLRRDDLAQARVATERAPTAEELRALDLAWRVCKHVKSNAIVFGAPDHVLGIGAGQMSRVDASRLAAEKARLHGHDLAGSVIASDAFFPFADGVEVAAEAGATAVVQPGGSKRDPEVVRAADRLGLAMLFTGHRHFRH